MPLIPFPNVPNVPGVPQIPRSPQVPTPNVVGLGLLESVLFAVIQSQIRWGVFDSNGNALGNPSLFTGLTENILQLVGLTSTYSTNAVEYKKETQVSDFPVERGGFATYNKVQRPADPTVTLCLDATPQDCNTFLNAIENATNSTDLYSVVTPEITYVGYTVQSYNYQRRQMRGATLLIVELQLLEVRQVSAAFSSIINQPKDPSATPQVDSGVVQPQPPSTSLLNSLFSKIKSLANVTVTGD